MKINLAVFTLTTDVFLVIVQIECIVQGLWQFT